MERTANVKRGPLCSAPCRLFSFEMVTSPVVKFLSMVRLFGFGQKVRNELIATLADLAARLLEIDVVAEPDQPFMPGDRMQIDGIKQSPVQIENDGFKHVGGLPNPRR